LHFIKGLIVNSAVGAHEKGDNASGYDSTKSDDDSKSYNGK
jgi:hypothetical protein